MGQDSLSVNQLLRDEACSCEHGKTAVLQLLGTEVIESRGI
jgi:hypothetical protein